ncbi:RNase adapter RapZ [Marinicellulosiphila megalodicopiae]|uniref:RNase adapter RapZ n=1 Tax=Marinicellulosiphila megalodicopiae TaxID=2724896 RepID=UPI003BB0415E
MKLIILSGRSGSGKSTALQALEDAKFHCIDNFPVSMLLDLPKNLQENDDIQNLALCIDARNSAKSLKKFAHTYNELSQDIDTDLIFLDADPQTLFKRFSTNRRRHPLTNDNTSLSEAIEIEKYILKPLEDFSQLKIDTSKLSEQQLRTVIRDRVIKHEQSHLSLQFISFGFKHGAPTDADFVFDVRCLPNPYWNPDLRSYTGQHQPIIDFLSEQPEVSQMYVDIFSFIEKWIPQFEQNNRSYLTVAIGCTGGQHRSVYLAEKLTKGMQTKHVNVQVRHRELGH